MTCGRLEKLYEVPAWRDADGSIWRRLLDDLHLVGGAGWAIGSGQILRTDNAGKTWRNQIEAVNYGRIMTHRVFAIDKQTAWLINVTHQAANNCYYTRDSGEEWREKRLPALLHPEDIFFFNQRRGWIISNDGTTPAGDAMIHITSDGGRSWQSRELEISGTATKLKFHTPEQGFLIQHTGADNRTKTICNLLASRDGGENWFVVKSFNRLLTDLHAIDAENFLVVGERGFISRTSDRGMSWKRSYTKVQSCLNVIEFNGYGKGIAAGDFGAILISDDHGEHWFRFGELEEPYNVVGVSFVDPNQAILATDTSIFSLTL